MTLPVRGRAARNARPGGAPPRTFTRDFPATPSQVAPARRFLAGLLGDSPVTADAVSCLSELASNAVLHSGSGRPGGHFTVRASLYPGQVRVCPAQLRVEVEDAGGPWVGLTGHDEECGRGLLIVATLAREWGITGDGRHRRVVWFECTEPGPGGAAARADGTAVTADGASAARRPPPAWGQGNGGT
jgi:anti-sigma regulatory factor (Ser/Thr protein kinase)